MLGRAGGCGAALAVGGAVGPVGSLSEVCWSSMRGILSKKARWPTSFFEYGAKKRALKKKGCSTRRSSSSASPTAVVEGDLELSAQNKRLTKAEDPSETMASISA